MNRLITKEDIAKYREISRSVRDDKINPYIDDAQFLDIKKLTGTRLYNDILKRKDDEVIQKLLNTGEYEYKGEIFYNPGLIRVHCHFAFARYVLFGSYTDTSFGLIQKSNQDSQPVPQTSKRDIYKQERQTAVEYWNDVALFLNRKSNEYPLWKSNCQKRSFGLNISKITLE